MARAPTEFYRLIRIEHILCFADNVFGDKDKAYSWLLRPNRSLDNRTPLNLLHNETDIHQIEILLGRIQHGICS